MSFVPGAIGALIVLALFAAGVFTGWKLKAYDDARVSTTRAKELSEDERDRLIQEQEAFKLIQNYTVDRAYGIVNDDGP